MWCSMLKESSSPAPTRLQHGINIDRDRNKPSSSVEFSISLNHRKFAQENKEITHDDSV